MPKTRYDYEKQHEEDVLKIQELTATVSMQSEELASLNEKMEDTNYLNSLLVSELRRTAQPGSPPVADETYAGRKVKLTESLTRVIKLLYDEGQSQRQIADTLGVSVGLVNKACNLPSQPET